MSDALAFALDLVQSIADEEHATLSGMTRDEFRAHKLDTMIRNNRVRGVELRPAELERIAQNIDRTLAYDWQCELDRRAKHAEERARVLRERTSRRAADVAMRLTPSDCAAIEAMSRWRTSTSSNVAILTGPPGTGKTVTAVWWAYHSKYLPVFVRATEIATASRYDDARNKWLDANALIVDDLGAEYLDAKGSLLTDIDELVDKFYADPDRRLVITSNLPPKQFAERYGNRVADRLRECGTWIAVTGESRRRKADS